MDLLHSCLVDAGVQSRRVHSSEWLCQLHRALHLQPRGVPQSIQAAALAGAAGARVLCLDELELSDIADSAMVARAFPALAAAGVSLVLTSNSAPEKLYENGINRVAVVMPLIRFLRETSSVVALDCNSAGDYRAGARDACALRWPLGHAAAAWADEAWAAMLQGATEASRSVPIPGAGREVLVPRAAGRLCRFTYEELCEGALSAYDFHALAGAFDVFLLTGVPSSDGREDDTLRRIILLIDVLYDARKALLLTAAAPPAGLLPAAVKPPVSSAATLGLVGGGAGEITVGGAGGSSGRSTTWVGQDIEWSATGRQGASLAQLGRTMGSFAAAAAPRAQSRLTQMLSINWAAEHAGGVPPELLVWLRRSV